MHGVYQPLDAAPENWEGFPGIENVEGTEREINALFKPYVFLDFGKMEVWTSCCGHHEVVDRQRRIEEPRFTRIWNISHNAKGLCPFCGRIATYKHTRYLKSKKNLREYQPMVCLTTNGNDLYAQGFWAAKDYETLNAMPEVKRTAAYRFSIKEHCTEQRLYFCGGQEATIVKDKYPAMRNTIREPLYKNGVGTVPYSIIGIESVANSDFKYCCFNTTRLTVSKGARHVIYSNAMKFLAVASVYPDKVEMLIKNGMGTFVEELVRDGRKNATIFNWEANSFKNAFKLTRQELKEAQKYKLSGKTLTVYIKQNREFTMAELDQIEKGYYYDDLFSFAKKHNIPAKKLWKYINAKTPEKWRVRHTYNYYRDYIEMAKKLGWVMDEATMFPPNLTAHHDRALAEKVLRDEREKEERIAARNHQLDEQVKEHEKELRRRQKKYNIEAEGYFIRVAETGSEIVKEGATLQHCVGGYAERHIKGLTTILFLRRTETPEASLYTIEMDKNRLVQIHGYKNERFTDERPEEKMAWLLEPWLAWLEAGSPRDKTGKPKIVFNRKESKTA